VATTRPVPRGAQRTAGQCVGEFRDASLHGSGAVLELQPARGPIFVPPLGLPGTACLYYAQGGPSALVLPVYADCTNSD